MSWFRRLVNVARTHALSRDLDRELAFHLAEREDELIGQGMSPAQAAHEARRRFGNHTLQKERTHDRDVLVWLESILADLRHAARTLVASPAFTLVAVLSLALGLGANTAIFSLTNAVVLKSLPVREPEQLLAVELHDPTSPSSSTRRGSVVFTNPQWEAIRDLTHVFSGAFAYHGRTVDLSNGGLVQRARGALVSGDFFDVLGVQRVAGRLLSRADDVRGCSGAAVVSGGFATRELGGANAAVGRTLSVDGHPMEIVGIADPRFFGLEVGRSVDVYIPLCSVDLLDGAGTLDKRSRWYLNVLGRPAPGLTTAAVRARLAAAAPAVFSATVPTNGSAANQKSYLALSLSVLPAGGGISEIRDQYARALWMLLGGVAIVLIIACANIANLLLARAAGREREIAIRLSLGAARRRVMRQLLTESVLLAALGALVGTLFAVWAERLIVSWISVRQSPVSLDLSLDWRVLGFTILAALLTVIAFGLVPAWRATRVDPQSAMKSGGRGLSTGRRQRVSRVVVAAQLALSLVLVTGAGLLLASFRNLDSIDPGFRREGVLVIQMDFSHAASDDAHRLAMEREILQRLRSLPGVRSASASALTAMSGTGWNDLILAPGWTARSLEDSLANFNEVTGEFFATTGTPLLAGRTFTAADGDRADVVAIVSRAMARRFFGTDNPIGRTFRTPVGDSTSPSYQVIGVVGDTKYQSLDEQTGPIVYLPMGSKLGIPGWTTWSYELRTDLPAASIVPAVREAVARVSPTITLDPTTIAAQIDATLARPRLLATLSSFFGALALLLAIIGLYGTLAYDVARRRNEIGIRMALGAAWRHVVRLVLGDAGRIVFVGVLAGVAFSVAGARLLSAFLFGVTPRDPVTLIGAVLLLALTALVATMIPAWRAARTDPMEALREE